MTTSMGSYEDVFEHSRHDHVCRCSDCKPQPRERTEYEERRRVCERVGHQPAEQPRPGKTSIWVCLRCGRSVSPDGKRLAA